MRVHLVSFGPLKSVFPEGGLVRELPAGQTVGAVLDALREEGLLSADALKIAAVAVNRDYVGKTHILQDGDEMAILPPVSGGTNAPDSASSIVLTSDPIDTTSIVAGLKAGEDGAVVVFDGIVRNNTRGRATLHLDYEAYEEMALKQMAQLREQAIRDFAIREVAIVHRLGRLAVGETSVLIAVASAHRAAAFDACRWVIDTLKKTVPIWKREQFADGVVWADGEPFPEDLAGAAR